MTSTVLPFELAVYCEVFGIDRTGRGVPAFDFAICSEHPGVPVPTSGGLHVTPTEGLDRLAAADLVAVAPPASPTREVSPAVSAALHAAVDRGARVVAVCTAGFVLASAGLLDSRTIAAHWLHADRMREWFPAVHVDPSVLYVDDDPIFTSAGTAAGIDLCLHLIRMDHGSAAAEAVARGMVLGPQRAARQAPPPPPRRPDNGIDELLEWVLGNLHEDLSIDVLARRAFLSTRSFARRFRAATGTSPYAWILEQRVRLAQQLLETDPRVGVEEAAGRAGFSSAALLRQHFQRRFGCSPSAYRARFATTSPG
ncbi:MAG TPA: helix-turn-helix domain-containing protein [Actinoplanes sp.]|jgi:transcriptional regulator GlxA family with amidase domain|nr:helix-turn-helix domain-containing protein [Actinoplanes sp.]